MNRIITLSFVALSVLVYPLYASFDLSCTEVDPRGICPEMSYNPTDSLGQILGTIPCTNPGPYHAWVGNVWVNGELVLFKNQYPDSSPPKLFRLNPATGDTIAIVTLPFNGYVLDGTYDDTGIWVCQWSPVNVIRKFSLTGVQLDSFIPPTGEYSARCINWDGHYLWVGCNRVSQDTKLIKMTTSGTIVQEWTTGSVVGWYMGGEFGSGQPNANLYVVDNIGNTIKRLNLGSNISINAQISSPAISPDVAEGLSCIGDYLWHNGAYASQGVIWYLHNGYYSDPLFGVSMTPLNPPIILPASGGSFDFNASVTRSFAPPGPFVVWARIKYPDGIYSNPTLGPITINPPITVSRMRTQTTPGSWPSGDYVYCGYANFTYSYPATSGGMNFSKSAVNDGNPWITEAICTGEPFLGEDVPPLIPRRDPPAGGKGGRGDFVFASPNPFNPTTTISYELRAVSYISLKVYDTAGRLVSTLVNGWREAGQHQVTFDGTHLASSIYFYTLSIGSQTLTGKMILLK